MAQQDRQWAMLETLVMARKEASKLRQALKDLVDFDIGEPPERDALDAALGSSQLERMEKAWGNACDQVGPREMPRFYGDKP